MMVSGLNQITTTNMKKQFINQQMAKWDEQFKEKHIISNREAQLFIKHALPLAYDTAIQDAEKCVPEEKEEDWRKIEAYFGDEKVAIANNNTIFNSCRDLTLQNLQELQSNK